MKLVRVTKQGSHHCEPCRIERTFFIEMNKYVYYSRMILDKFHTNQPAAAINNP